MRILLNFKCSTGKTIERLIDSTTKSVKCDCGGKAVRVLSAPRYFDNTTGKSPARH